MTVGVELRAFEPGDLPTLYENQADPVAVAMGQVPSRDREAFEAHWEKVLADPATIIRTIVADGKVAGAVQSWPDGDVRLSGYWLGQEFWGRGIASAAMAEFLKVDLHRPLHADVAATNVASMRVLEKSGYTREGQDEKGFRYILAAP